MSNGYMHYAGLKSADVITVGPTKAADVVNYTSLATAFDNMVPGGHMIILPGTYSLAATETINYACTIEGIGDVTINGGTAGIEDRLIMINKPGAGTATTTIKIENIKFVNAYAAADVVEIDNDGGATGDLVVEFVDCGFDAGSGGLSLDIDQTTNTINQYVRVSSRLGLRRPMEGCNFALSKAASEVVIEGYDFGASVITLGTADVASVYTLISCQFESAAMTTGGASSVIFNAQACAKISSAAIVDIALTDFDATVASENLQVGTIAT